MSRVESRYIRLLGKIIQNYGVLLDTDHFSPEDLDILRLAKTEYDFYHAHERVESGTDAAYDAAKKSAVAEIGKREKLSLKTTR